MPNYHNTSATAASSQMGVWRVRDKNNLLRLGWEHVARNTQLRGRKNSSWMIHVLFIFSHCSHSGSCGDILFTRFTDDTCKYNHNVWWPVTALSFTLFPSIGSMNICFSKLKNTEALSLRIHPRRKQDAETEERVHSSTEILSSATKWLSTHRYSQTTHDSLHWLWLWL